MATIVQTGFKLAQTVISNGAVTGNGWSNPNNLLLSDGDVSGSNPGAGVASDVIIGNFLANVPSNAVITGIELQIIGYRGSQTSPVLTLTPVAVDNTSGSDVYYPYVTPFTGLTPDLASYVLGSPTYLFATAWTPDMINNFKLQLIANGDIYIDAALLNVFYYIPDEILPPPPPPPTCDDCNSPVQAQAFYLAQPFLSGDRYAYLQSFNYPDGTPIKYSDLGSCGGYVTLVFDEGVPKVGTSNFEENAKTAVWTTEPNGTVKLDFVDINVFRGLMFHTPYTADSSLRSNHDAQSKVIISNSAPFYGQYLQRCQIGVTVSAPIQVKEENAVVVEPTVKFNFQGPGVSVVQNVTDPLQADITIPGSGGVTPPQILGVTSASSHGVKVSSLPADLEISGLNRGSSIQISTEQLVTVLSVTVGGVSATQEAVSTDAGNNLRSETWICVNPPLGTQQVLVTLSAPAWLTFGAEALGSVNTASPIGTVQTASGNNNSPTLSLSTAHSYSSVIDGLCTGLTPILYTPGPGQSLNWALVANADTRQGASSFQPSGVAPDGIIMSYGMTQSTPWVYTAVEIRGIGSSVPGVQSVTGLDTDNTDPANPIVEISVDGASITGSGTPGDPLVAHATSLTPASIQLAVNQVAHGLSQGNLIKSNGVANQYAKAKGDSAVNAEVVGIVITVVDADNFVYSQDIMGYAGSGIPAATPGVGVFLDQATAGAITTTVDTTTVGLVVKPVGVILASASKMNFSSSYLGLINN